MVIDMYPDAVYRLNEGMSTELSHRLNSINHESHLSMTKRKKSKLMLKNLKNPFFVPLLPSIKLFLKESEVKGRELMCPNCKHTNKAQILNSRHMAHAMCQVSTCNFSLATMVEQNILF